MSIALMSHRAALKRFPGGWTPKELGTLSLWLDADDATTITLATGVSQWNDKSGNGYNVSQATGAAQPTWTKNYQNGRAAVEFDAASSQTLLGTDALDILTGGLSIGIVFYGTQTPISKAAGSIDVNGEWALNRGAFNIQVGGTVYRASLTAISTMAGYIAIMDRTTGAILARNGTDGTASVTTGLPNTTSYNTATAFQISGLVSNATAYLTGAVCEIVVSLSSWSTGDREKVEGYLAHKWGLAGSLPAGHTYKSVAP